MKSRALHGRDTPLSVSTNQPDVRAIWVVGHRNPDTDCTVAAMTYAALKQSQADGTTLYIPAVLGPLNPETRAVLARASANSRRSH